MRCYDYLYYSRARRLGRALCKHIAKRWSLPRRAHSGFYVLQQAPEHTFPPNKGRLHGLQAAAWLQMCNSNSNSLLIIVMVTRSDEEGEAPDWEVVNKGRVF